jgi:hypothetical protein
VLKENLGIGKRLTGFTVRTALSKKSGASSLARLMGTCKHAEMAIFEYING